MINFAGILVLCCLSGNFILICSIIFYIIINVIDFMNKIRNNIGIKAMKNTYMKNI